MYLGNDFMCRNGCEPGATLSLDAANAAHVEMAVVFLREKIRLQRLRHGHTSACKAWSAV